MTTVKSRAESFFGLHFDLHPRETDTALGADLTKERIAELLRRVRPDYVQYDCKGHAGWTGYPTKVGWASPGIVKDSLSLWRKVTREHGVALYVHYSGVWDSVAVRRRPEWARLGPDGVPDQDKASAWGAYVDDLLIPQLRELIDTYDIDGVWVDGECWAVRPDYAPAALEAFRRETGIETPPRQDGNPGWREFLALQRRRFEEYVAHYARALHACKPGFQITSNWMYSLRMPSPVRAPLDYLSGDFTPQDAVNSARLEGRRFAALREAHELPWDLMAWGFAWEAQAGGTKSRKPAIQLMQEAAVVLAQGGGFQVYYQPTRTGWIDDYTIAVAEHLAGFCRARQAVSRGTHTLPQVAVLLSETSQYDALDRQGSLYALRGLTATEGAVHALLELHYSVDLLTEHQLVGPNGRAAEYPVVVVPDCPLLGPGVAEQLVEHARRGGRLLVIGAMAAAHFRSVLEASGVTLQGEPAETPANHVLAEGAVPATSTDPDASIGPSAPHATSAGTPGITALLGWTGGPWQDVTVNPGAAATVAGQRYAQFDWRGEGQVAATVAPLGAGQIGAIYGPVAAAHGQHHHPGTRRFIGQVMRALFPNPAVRVEGPATVEVALRRQIAQDGAAGERTLVHLCNLTGMPSGPRQAGIDEVPAAGPIQIRLSQPAPPRRVEVVPAINGWSWSWDAAASEVHVHLPRLEIHHAIVCEP